MSLSVAVVVVLVVSCISCVSAQAVTTPAPTTPAPLPPPLCNSVGCQQGTCVQSALVAPFCRCNQGYSIQNDPNICEGINECTEYPGICGPLPVSPFGPFYPVSPRMVCVDTPQSYFCRSLPPPPQQSFFNLLNQYRLWDALN